ncbi:MAG: hypothetical protein WBX22_12120 [Silvibacterium sp.]
MSFQSAALAALLFIILSLAPIIVHCTNNDPQVKDAMTITGLVNLESVSQESSGIPASFQADPRRTNLPLIQARVDHISGPDSPQHRGK